MPHPYRLDGKEISRDSLRVCSQQLVYAFAVGGAKDEPHVLWFVDAIDDLILHVMRCVWGVGIRERQADA